MVYHTALTLHIIGIVILSGTIFIDFFVTRQFWKADASRNESKTSIGLMIEKMQRLMPIGGLLSILAGIWLISIVHAWAGQIWFHIKMGILILVLVNALAFRRRLGKSLIAVAENNSDNTKAVKVKSNLYIVQVIQILLIILMFILSVFKFN